MTALPTPFYDEDDRGRTNPNLLNNGFDSDVFGPFPQMSEKWNTDNQFMQRLARTLQLDSATSEEEASNGLPSFPSFPRESQLASSDKLTAAGSGAAVGNVSAITSLILENLGYFGGAKDSRPAGEHSEHPSEATAAQVAAAASLLAPRQQTTATTPDLDSKRLLQAFVALLQRRPESPVEVSQPTTVAPSFYPEASEAPDLNNDLLGQLFQESQLQTPPPSESQDQGHEDSARIDTQRSVAGSSPSVGEGRESTLQSEHEDSNGADQVAAKLLHSEGSLNLDLFKVFPCKNESRVHDRKNCPYFHSQRDRRRLPVTYKAEQCEEHFDVEGDFDCVCQNGDNCDKCHNRHELLYHPFIYKQRFCSSYNCLECHRGRFCAFAHTRDEIRCELFSEEHERNPESDFFMNKFKTLWCPYGIQHDWHGCLYAHTYQDCRRSPNIRYGSEPCPYWQKDLHSADYQKRCPLGPRCPYSHGSKEQLYHPAYYKTMPCADYKTKRCCPRGELCAFYHDVSEKRIIFPSAPSLKKNNQDQSGTENGGGNCIFDYTQPIPTALMKHLQPNFMRPPLFNLDDFEAFGHASRVGHMRQQQRTSNATNAPINRDTADATSLANQQRGVGGPLLMFPRQRSFAANGNLNMGASGALTTPARLDFRRRMLGEGSSMRSQHQQQQQPLWADAISSPYDCQLYYPKEQQLFPSNCRYDGNADNSSCPPPAQGSPLSSYQQSPPEYSPAAQFYGSRTTMMSPFKSTPPPPLSSSSSQHRRQIFGGPRPSSNRLNVLYRQGSEYVSKKQQQHHSMLYYAEEL